MNCDSVGVALRHLCRELVDSIPGSAHCLLPVLVPACTRFVLPKTRSEKTRVPSLHERGDERRSVLLTTLTRTIKKETKNWSFLGWYVHITYSNAKHGRKVEQKQHISNQSGNRQGFL